MIVGDYCEGLVEGDSINSRLILWHTESRQEHFRNVLIYADRFPVWGMFLRCEDDMVGFSR